jgi:hypothetical protein
MYEYMKGRHKVKLSLKTKPKTKLRGFGPRANYIDGATAACWRS